MKIIGTIFCSLFLISTVYADIHIHGCCSKDHKECHDEWMENISIDVDDGSVIIKNNKDRHERVELSEEYELYVNGKFIRTNREQRRYFEDYHDLTCQIEHDAKKIGKEGAKIGARGAKLGVTAVFNVLKLLSSDYDSDDLEREMERESSKLEANAEKLERKAEKLEEMVDELEELHFKLKESIPELDELEWF